MEVWAEVIQPELISSPTIPKKAHYSLITSGLDGCFSSSYLLTQKRINATYQASKNDSHLRKDDFFPYPGGRWRAERKLTFLEALLRARHRSRHVP